MSLKERIPRVLQISAAVVTLTGGAVAVMNLPFFDDEPDGSPTVSASPTVDASPRSAPTDAGEFPGTRDTILNEPPHVPPVAVITDVRISEQDGFDRVVFEFRDNSPGYRVEYVTAPVEEFSGKPLEIQGEAYLQVQLRGAQAHSEGDSTLEERRYDPDLPAVEEVVITGDAGGRVTAVIGLAQPLDYRVERAIDPFRTIVEIGHP